ncbi:Neuropeptide Y receptor invertebrate [Paragonimus heterotremus]|uniref:Neuropeptide Y receptor invertebrate n=1 Tax=Paragonimus heterotremus TaxID=100268 RepID=A0A8J4SLA2_9TREM|nr:Neuropeptide Y receptor invertebrate [Paragonimus heterotremus]
MSNQFPSLEVEKCRAKSLLYSNNSSTCDIAKDVFAVKFIILLLYSLIAFIGLAGNGLVIWVVARTKSIQTITNIFIANLAVSDILMCLVATPFTPVSLYMRSWTLPEVVCKLLPITMGVSVYVSTLTSMAIALDRFFVIVHPFLPRMRIWLCFIIIVTIWVIAILISMPLAVYHQKHQDKEKNIWACRENWPKESSREVFTVVSFVLQFVVPCSIISICYFRISLILRMRLRTKIGKATKRRLQDENEIRRKKRTNTILIAMVVIFVICWIPLNMLFIAMDVLSEGQTKVFNESKYVSLIFLVCHLLAMSSAVYNPFLYAWMNKNFKKEVRRILPCLCRASSRSHMTTALRTHTQPTLGAEYSTLPTNDRLMPTQSARPDDLQLNNLDVDPAGTTDDDMNLNSQNTEQTGLLNITDIPMMDVESDKLEPIPLSTKIQNAPKIRQAREEARFPPAI